MHRNCHSTTLMLFKNEKHPTETILTTTSSPEECDQHLINYRGNRLYIARHGQNHFYIMATLTEFKLHRHQKVEADVYLNQNDEGITELRVVPNVLLGKRSIIILCCILSLGTSPPLLLSGGPWEVAALLFGFGFIPGWFWFVRRIQDESLIRNFRDYMLFGKE